MHRFIKFLLNMFVYIIAVYGGFCGVAHACETNEIDVLGDGTNCEAAKFTITTTNLSANTEFRFYMSAMGTFYVDWGDGTVDTITRNDTTETLYNHIFISAGVKTIRFGGLASGYSDTQGISTVRFNSSGSLVSGIHGSIGQIFPTLNSGKAGYRNHPQFKQTFNATGITSIPPELFNGITHIYNNIFTSTFYNCVSLASIPENLFWGILYGTNANGAFASTFTGCSALTEIPQDLFKTIHALSDNEFAHTFRFCKSLTSIPENLFKNVTKAYSNMFTYTFGSCTGLTSLPDKFFSSITDYTARSVFLFTFDGCTNLSRYIPPTIFSGLLSTGLAFPSQLNESMFSRTNLATTCPAGTVQYITGYEDYWDGHVSCVDENLVCGAGEYLPAHGYECKPCLENNYCVGGTYPYSESNTSGITPCPTGYSSSIGASACEPNTITINWDGAESGTCTYGGTITTPTTSPTRRGYTFVGWTFDAL